MSVLNVKESPIKGSKKLNISSGYGKRRFYNNITKKYVSDFHYGIDITNGSKVIAFEKGKVTAVRKSIKGYSEKYSEGNYVVIKHDNNIYTYYFHLKYGSISLKKGDILNKGDLLGLKGSTGFSTGAHLHFGIKENGCWVNPKDYLICKKLISTKSAIKENIVISNSSKKEVKTYKVKKGDNLTRIASFYNTSWKKIYEKNKEIIGDDPNLIKPGQVLKI